MKTSNGVSHVGALQYAGQHADHIRCPRENHPARGRGRHRGRGLRHVWLIRTMKYILWRQVSCQVTLGLMTPVAKQLRLAIRS
jgi:hypothetical protein